MPKSKEQKQLEALEREGKSVLPFVLGNFLQRLPGGSLWTGGYLSQYDMSCLIDDARKYREACRKHRIAIPIHEDNDSVITHQNTVEFLRRTVTVLWIGALADDCAKAREASGLSLNGILSKSGEKRDQGDFYSIKEEVQSLKRQLSDYSNWLRSSHFQSTTSSLYGLDRNRAA